VTVASPIAPTEATRPAPASDAAAPHRAVGSTDFAAALAAATTDPADGPSAPPATSAAPAPGVTGLTDPANLPSVSLAAMVEAFAQSTALGAPAQPAGTLGGDTQGVGAVAALGAASATGAAGPAAGRGAEILDAGEAYLGVPYRWGGTDPARGFDCSGFVQRTFADLGISLPRVSVDQARAGTAVASMDQARPGDLVFWNGDGSRPNHIGIYAGEGRMLVAPRSGDVVRYQDISREPHAIRRIV
jgi:cell wall-associated NlpC family hydrolase